MKHPFCIYMQHPSKGLWRQAPSELEDSFSEAGGAIIWELQNRFGIDAEEGIGGSTSGFGGISRKEKEKSLSEVFSLNSIIAASLGLQQWTSLLRSKNEGWRHMQWFIGGHFVSGAARSSSFTVSSTEPAPTARPSNSALGVCCGLGGGGRGGQEEAGGWIRQQWNTLDQGHS